MKTSEFETGNTLAWRAAELCALIEWRVANKLIHESETLVTTLRETRESIAALELAWRSVQIED